MAACETSRQPRLYEPPATSGGDLSPHRASYDGEISAMIHPTNVRQARLTNEDDRHMVCFLSTQAAALSM